LIIHSRPKTSRNPTPDLPARSTACAGIPQLSDK
jgi:hypothetical protein